jgi:plasmid stabilization system protein ParE
MPKILYSKAALKDLQQIQEYLTDNWGKDTAKKIIKNIVSSIKDLEQHPGLGVSLGKMIDFPTEYRYLFLEKSYVFYHLKGDILCIVRIANERQDFIHLLFGI